MRLKVDRNRFRRLAAAIPPKSDPVSRWMTLLTVAAIGVYLFHIAYFEYEVQQGRWPRECPLGRLEDMLLPWRWNLP